MSALPLLGLPVAGTAHVDASAEGASHGQVLWGLVPVYVFALVTAMWSCWWIGRVIASHSTQDDPSDEASGGDGGLPRPRPLPRGPLGDGLIPIDPVSPPKRPARGNAHEVPARARTRPDHAPRPVRTHIRNHGQWD